MIFIGITGGVGAGKSEILSYMRNKENTRVMLADEIAHDVMEPGEEAYLKICEAFKGEDIFADIIGDALKADANCSVDIKKELSEQAEIKYPPFDRKKLAQVIFSDASKREQLNAIVHPAVKNYVKEQFQLEKERGTIRVLVLEAALLLDDHYDVLCDECWYIYTSEENRRTRLKASRGYSDEKIDSIFRCQLSEEAFRRACQEVIDNNGSKEETFHQIDQALSNAFARLEDKYRK
jgi:dephospho-CoA kinase